MSTTFKSQMKEVMQMAWSFVKKNGYSMSEALKCAWANFKLKAALKVKIVEFYFKKTDGTLRQAFGTLKENPIGVYFVMKASIRGVSNCHKYLYCSSVKQCVFIFKPFM